MNPRSPRRRRYDRIEDADGFWPKAWTFLRLYAHDLWLVAISLGVLLLSVAQLVQGGNAADQAYDACQRAQVVIPIQVKALEAAARAGIVTPEELMVYRAQRPAECTR